VESGCEHQGYILVLAEDQQSVFCYVCAEAIRITVDSRRTEEKADENDTEADLIGITLIAATSQCYYC
jgi:hypothetical protein